MTSKFLAYAVMYWTLIVAGTMLVFQGLSIAWRHYETLRPAKSLMASWREPEMRGAHYAWWGLIGSVAVSSWHVLEIAGGNSLPAYWPRLLEWLLWSGIHLYLNFRIERYVDHAAVAD